MTATPSDAPLVLAQRRILPLPRAVMSPRTLWDGWTNSLTPRSTRRSSTAVIIISVPIYH